MFMSDARVVSEDKLYTDQKTRSGSNVFGSYADAVRKGSDSLTKMKYEVSSNHERRVSFSPLTNEK